MKIAYQCMGKPSHSFKCKSKYMEGVRCPNCQRPISPTAFDEQEYNILPEYEDLLRQSKDSKREVEMKRLDSIKYSGSFTSTNRDGPGVLVNSLLKEDFDWLVEQLEIRITKDV